MFPFPPAPENCFLNLVPNRHQQKALAALRRPLLIGLLIVFLPAVLIGQDVQYTKNTPDQTMRSDARIDPASHALSIQIPLGAYPGRAGLTLPISITYSSKFRHLEQDGDFQPWYWRPYDLYYLYLDTSDNRSVAGWTSSLVPPRIEGDAGAYSSYSGNLGQPGGIYPSVHNISRIRINLGDGSSHELRQDDTPRGPGANPASGPFYAVDGSQMRFEGTGGSGDTGTLFMSDGSRYIFAASQATHYIDRNGNTLSYNNTLKQWTDTLGRTLKVPFYSTGYPQAVADQEYRLPGFNGNDRVYIFRWRHLIDPQTNESVLSPPYQELYYAGDYDCGQFYYNPDGFHSVSPSLFPNNNPRNPICVYQQRYNPVVLSEIELPNGQSYRFTYNPWGEIDKMYFPTGGYERYHYEKIKPMTFMKRPFDITNRGVTDRWVSHDGTSGSEAHWQYGIEYTPNSNGPYATTMTAPDGTFTRTYLHAQPDAYDGNWHHSAPYGFDDPRMGRTYDERIYASATGPMLRRSLTLWTTSGPTPGGFYTAARNPQVSKQVEILLDTGSSNALAKTVTYDYDQDGNRILTNEYDYVVLDSNSAQNTTIGLIATGPTLLRSTEVTYFVNDPNIDPGRRAEYRARNMLALPTSTLVKDGANTVVAQSSVSYDEPAFPLITGGSPAGWTDPGSVVRGNATTTTRWLNFNGSGFSAFPGGSYLSTHAQYDQFGNLRKSWDALNNESEIEYSSAYQFAYPTKMTSSIPDPFGQYGSSVAFDSTTVYDLTTGFIISATDPNYQTTYFGYTDPQTAEVEKLNRIRTVTRPDGGLTTFNYNDTPGSLRVQTLTKQDATRSLDASQSFDGLGRPNRSFLNLGNGSYNTTDTQYDSLGRVRRVSNPYTSTGPGSAINPAGNWTTNVYDTLGRSTSVTTPDGAQVTTVYGLSTSNVLGQTVKVADQALKVRRSLTDALGRLVRVDEPDQNGNLGDVESPNQPTSYGYDVLGNLRIVTQGSQQRFFSYDSLSRLLRARNPEVAVNANLPPLTDPITGSQWSMAYSYDGNGNLTQKIDPRNVVATYAYDALNRNTTVTYTNDPASTPTVSRFYDGYRGANNNNLANSKGRLWQTETSGSAGSRTTSHNFDAAGRPRTQEQQFYNNNAWSVSYTVQRVYDLAGQVLTQTYPSGHTVNYSYDSAGRTSSFTGNLGEGVQRTYANEFKYTESGALQQERFGTDTPLYHKQRYNVRGQLWDMRLSTVPYLVDPGNDDRGSIINYYSNNFVPGSSAADNNGNLLRQQIFIPGSAFFQDDFVYDSLNRLKSISEKLNGTGSDSFKQAYTFDRWGNRTIDQANTTANVPHPEYTVDPGNNNRLLAPAGFTHEYDAAGNQTRDTLTTNSPTAGYRTYDAENRIIAAQKPVSGKVSWAYYTYNGDGQRVRRKIATYEIWQVYGFEGELVAEYPQTGPSVAVAQPQKEYGYRNGQLLVTTEPFVNLAWNKPATQIDTYQNYTADKAVDGDVDGDLEDGHASATDSHANSWWQVDLQSVQTIDSITVWGRTDCCPQQTSDFYVLVSDVPFTSNDLNSTLAQPGVSNYLHSGFSGPSTATGATSINVNRTGRYVRVQLAGTNYLVLGEVQVWGQAAKVNWLVADHLGTPRMIVDKTGSLAGVSRHDYLPFGEEIFAGTGGRTTTQGYDVADGIRQKFTDKERDMETKLDYFKARYYASTQGRFTSTDPIQILVQKLFDPQQWHMYSYVRNNPIGLTDPTGKYVCSDDQKKCARFEQARQNALKSKDADTVRGAKAYGERSSKTGDKGDNGVYVDFADTLNNDRGGSVSRRDTGVGLDPNSPNGLRATLNVTIKSDLAGDEEVVAHEGSHVADYQAFVNALPRDGTVGKDADALNITRRQSETRAYSLSIGYAQRGNKTLNFGPCGSIKDCKFPPAMMPAIRDQQIQDLLTTQYKNLDQRLWPEEAYKLQP